MWEGYIASVLVSMYMEQHKARPYIIEGWADRKKVNVRPHSKGCPNCGAPWEPVCSYCKSVLA